MSGYPNQNKQFTKIPPYPKNLNHLSHPHSANLTFPIRKAGEHSPDNKL